MSWRFSVLVDQLQIWEDSSAANMNVLQLPLLSHSRCSSNAASARGVLSTCLVLEYVAFWVALHFRTAQFMDNPPIIYLLHQHLPLPFLLLSFSSFPRRYLDEMGTALRRELSHQCYKKQNHHQPSAGSQRICLHLHAPWRVYSDWKHCWTSTAANAAKNSSTTVKTKMSTSKSCISK